MTQNLSPAFVLPPIAPRRHAARWVLAAVALCLLTLLFYSLVNNPRLEWGVVGQYLTGASILAGVGLTIELTAIAAMLGLLGGLALAIMRLSGNPVLAAISWAYVWLFRSVPMLVQLFFWFNIAALYPQIALWLPGLGRLWSAQMNNVITPFDAAVIALVLHEAAFFAEILRAGLLGVGRGQSEAARALGFTPVRALHRIILPQAMRTMLPPIANQVVSLLKTTSVVSVIALQDLLYSAQVIYERTFEVIPLLLVAAAWYLFMTSLLLVLQHYAERRLSRGARLSR